jgi:hypothetical protein
MAGTAVTAGTAGAVGTSGRTWTGSTVRGARIRGRYGGLLSDLRGGPLSGLCDGLRGYLRGDPRGDLRSGPSGSRCGGLSGGVCRGPRDGPRGGGQPAKTRTERPRVRNDRRGQEESARGPRVRRGGQRLHGAVVEGSRRGGGR